VANGACRRFWTASARRRSGERLIVRDATLDVIAMISEDWFCVRTVSDALQDLREYRRSRTNMEGHSCGG
jgi:hypothetical protein